MIRQAMQTAVHYADIHLVDEELTMRRESTRYGEVYSFTLDACLRRDGDAITLANVSEFSFRVMGEEIPVPRGMRSKWFEYLLAGDRERLLKHLKSEWKKAS